VRSVKPRHSQAAAGGVLVFWHASLPNRDTVKCFRRGVLFKDEKEHFLLCFQHQKLTARIYQFVNPLIILKRGPESVGA